MAPKKHPTISHEEARELHAQGRLKPAGLYEPDHAPKGTKFVLVKHPNGRDNMGLYRVKDVAPTGGTVAPASKVAEHPATSRSEASKKAWVTRHRKGK
jgi:hypothetical protein